MRTDQQDWSEGVVVLTRWDGWPRGWDFDAPPSPPLSTLALPNRTNHHLNQR